MTAITYSEKIAAGTWTRACGFYIKRIRLFSRFSVRFQIVLGLSSLLGSVVLLSIFVGLVPDRQSQELTARVKLAEVVAAMGSVLLRDGDASGFRYSLEYLVENYPGIHAVRLKRFSGGEFTIPTESASGSALASALAVKTDDVHIPIQQNQRKWGELTVHFVSNENKNWLSRYLQSHWALVGFITLLSFPLFYIFLGKVLKELNPSTAVPSRVRSALDTIAESLLVLDKQGDIVLANASFLELIGEPIEDLLGRSAKTLGWNSGQADDGFVWDDALYNGQPIRHKKTGFTGHSGEERTFFVNCSPVITADDTIGGVLISMDDITQLEKKEALLRESMEIAEQANNAKSVFLSNMSHEIRTPMTAILGFTEVMKRSNKQSESERQNYLNTISKSGEHLLELINDVLDLSKVESGAMQVESLPCNCASIANDVIGVLQSKAQEKSIGLSLEILTALPQEITADPSRLRQVFTNLVGNAIKFTDSGNVVVQLSIVDSISEPVNTLAVDIIDSGIGMSKEQQARIFDAFSQADASISRRFGGTGLGLSISRELTEAMGGKLTVTSKEGIGSTFHVHLPIGKNHIDLIEPDDMLVLLQQVEDEQISVWEIKPSRILVVDDGPENRQLLTIVLSDLGLDVKVAENGKEGVDALFDQADGDAFDLVFMDIQMPVMDGYTAVAEMRKRGAELPIVALTANAMKGFESKVINAGFSHYMVKPIDLDKMGALLARLLGGTQKKSSVGTGGGALEQLPQHRADSASFQKSEVSTNASTVSDNHDHPLISRLALNDARFIPLIEEFKTRLAEKLVELTIALDVEDWAQLNDFGHWLKGPAANLGLDELVVRATELQSAAKKYELNNCVESISAITSMQKLICTEIGEKSSAVESSDPAGIECSEIDDNTSPVFSALPIAQADFYEVVESFMERLEVQLSKMRKAMVQHDMDDIAQIAHWLRGSGSNVGYPGFLGLCDVLEDKASSGIGHLSEEMAAVERYAQRVFAGWQQTPRPAGLPRD